MLRVGAEFLEPLFDSTGLLNPQARQTTAGLVFMTQFLPRPENDEPVGQFIQDGRPVRDFRPPGDKGRQGVVRGTGRNKDVRGVTLRFTGPGSGEFTRWIKVRQAIAGERDGRACII